VLTNELLTTVLTTKETCAFLKVGRTTLWTLRRRREIRAIKRRGILRWSMREIQRWIDRNQEK
jgi:predicted DNA-binding transcriptional regulator AlpA